MTIVRDLHLDDYHASNHISHSKLSVFRRSPLLFKKTFIDKTVEREDTKALKTGRAFDCLLFEGREAYQAQYITTPKTYETEDGEVKPWNGNANACKSWSRTQTLQGRTIIDRGDALAFEAMLQSALHHPIAGPLLKAGTNQVTFRRHSQKYGLDLQVRPDQTGFEPIVIRDESGNVLLESVDREGKPCAWFNDAKTTEDFDDWIELTDPESPRAGKPVHAYGYHLQGSLAQYIGYQDIGETAHYLTVIEKREPFRTGVIRLNDEYMDLGMAQVDADLLRLRACMMANVWPGSPGRVITLAPPQWLLEKGNRMAVAAVDAGLPVGTAQ